MGQTDCAGRQPESFPMLSEPNPWQQRWLKLPLKGGHWELSIATIIDHPVFSCDGGALGSSLCFLPPKRSWRSPSFRVPEVCVSCLSATQKIRHVALRVKRNDHPCSKTKLICVYWILLACCFYWGEAISPHFLSQHRPQHACLGLPNSHYLAWCLSTYASATLSEAMM